MSRHKFFQSHQPWSTLDSAHMCHQSSRSYFFRMCLRCRSYLLSQHENILYKQGIYHQYRGFQIWHHTCQINKLCFQGQHRYIHYRFHTFQGSWVLEWVRRMYLANKIETLHLGKSIGRKSSTFQFWQDTEYLYHKCLRYKFYLLSLDKRTLHRQNISRHFQGFEWLHHRSQLYMSFLQSQDKYNLHNMSICLFFHGSN